MLVKFNPTLGTGNNSTTLYAYNFMRCVNAILTASASSTPVVRPLTAANTFDGATNMITQVIANTEAGGWTQSSSFNLVDASYAATGITNRTYVADWYNTSGKADYPYKKFSIIPNSLGVWTSYSWLDLIYGIHTATDYSGTAGYSNQTTSFLMTPKYGGGSTTSYPLSSGLQMGLATTANIGTALLQGMEFYMAATADYIIIINPLHQMYYMGTRTTQQWEDTYSNNPPIVCWTANVDDRYNSTPTTIKQNMKGAWMLTRDGTGAIRTSPSRMNLAWYENNGRSSNSVDIVCGPYWSDVSTSTTNPGVNGPDPVGDEFGGPLFRSTYQYAVTYGAPGTIIPTTTDSSGALVPPAFPINVMAASSSSVPGYCYLNRGGRCLGLYKSMGGPDSYLNNFYTVGQIFTIDGDSYTPILTNGETFYRDMFLIRAK